MTKAFFEETLSLVLLQYQNWTQILNFHICVSLICNCIPLTCHFGKLNHVVCVQVTKQTPLLQSTWLIQLLIMPLSNWRGSQDAVAQHHCADSSTQL